LCLFIQRHGSFQCGLLAQIEAVTGSVPIRAVFLSPGF
jgi:hypothetical protein